MAYIRSLLLLLLSYHSFPVLSQHTTDLANHRELDDAVHRLDDSVNLGLNASVDLDLDLPGLYRRQSGTTDPGQTGGGSSTSSSDDFTCGPGKPCGNGACCGESGWCGYGSTYCGAGCQSNCGAKAECGEYAATPGKTCPLNVCCSKFGFCGTTSDFCSAGCQSNCDVPSPPAAESDSQSRIIGYYEGWSVNHACGKMAPEDIPVEFLTHLNFAFAYVTPDDFRIVNMPDFPPATFSRVTDMKQKNPNMKVLIALGGWTFNDPGSTQTVFSSLASSESNRQKFIKNLLGFMSEYGFDGADIDWEYPGADDRGGSENDGLNFTQLLKEMKQAFGDQYLVTFTAPTSYWYLRHFDIKGSSEAADWVNLMSYDLHGVWDRNNPIGSQVLAHTNITEIDQALDLFWRTEVDPSKIVLGIGFYGRSFKLSDSACWKPGCQFSGPGDAGPCSATGGILSYKEIQDILAQTKAKPYYDSEAQVQYMVYGDNNWISFDDEKTFQKKVDFANKKGLSGLMIWAVDIDDDKGTAIRALSGNRQTDSEIALFRDSYDPSISHGSGDPSQCYITDCNGFCKSGWTPVGRANTDQNGKNRCNTKDSSQARYICCPSFSGPKPDDCRWDDSRSSALHSDCSGKCNIGEIELVDDSFGWKGTVTGGSYGDQCGRGYKVFCCKAGNMERYLDICTWTGCNEGCPSDKPHVLTTDTGGPKSNSRCKDPSGGNGGGSPFDPEASSGLRKLCCPREDSFKNCKWSSGKVCSTTCSIDQITLDRDPRGPDAHGHTCDNGREQTFCCDPPGGTERPFTPFNLENLFPPEYLPPAESIPSYDLVSFGGFAAGPAHIEDPNVSGVAFFLIAGSSTAVTSMKKRDNPDLVFVSCPADVLGRPHDELQTARIVCTGDDHDACFGLREGGVLGTVVHMPDECGGPSFARAVSLKPSENQHVSVRNLKRRPTSAVYDFSFDYDIAKVRRDAGDYSIRIDFSNVPGYWNAVVNSPGAGSKKRDLDSLVARFYGGDQAWEDKYNALKTSQSTADEIDIDLLHLIYDASETCPADGDNAGVDEGISAGVLGKSSVDLYYGFSLIATWTPGDKVNIHQAAGFVRPEGQTDATFKLGGQGGLDTSASFQGDTITKLFGVASTKGHNIYHGWAWFQGYQETGVKLRSTGGEHGMVSFDGYMEGRIQSDWGRAFINFPVGANGGLDIGTGERQRRSDQVSTGDNELNFVKQTPSGSITVSSTLRVGLQVGMSFSKPYQFAAPGELPDMSVSQEVFARFTIDNTATQACLSTSMGTEQQSHLKRGSSVGWPDQKDGTYVQALTQAGSKHCFNVGTSSKRSVAPSEKGVARRPRTDLAVRAGPGSGKPGAGNRLHDVTFTALAAALKCDGCSSCVELGKGRLPCCGCACLICKYGPAQNPRDDDVLDSGSGNAVSKRSALDSLTSTNQTHAGGSDITTGTERLLLLKRVSLEEGTPSDLSSHIGIDSDADTEPLLLSKHDVDAHDTVSIRDFGNELEHTSFLLDERATSPVLSTGPKTVKFCNRNINSDPYPSYPDMSDPNNPKKPTFDNSPLTANILKYYHNSSSSCLSWDITLNPQSDSIYRDGSGALTPQFYQTEHPFESQTISRFFNVWMQNNAATTRDCTFLRPQMADNQNPYPGATGSVARMAAQQLGSRYLQNRLTVFLTNSNRMKGALFSDVPAIKASYWAGLQPGDEQIQFLKEYGMIFTYMNTDGAWNSFCNTYNGIRQVFQLYDQATPGVSLTDEWRKWTRAELDRVAKKGIQDVNYLYNTHKPVSGVWYLWWEAKWVYVTSALGPRGNVGFTKTCANLT